MNSRPPYSVGTRNGQLVHLSKDEQRPLVNIVDDRNIIVGGFLDEELAKEVVMLLNEEYYD